jgi:phage terminase small subunit
MARPRKPTHLKVVAGTAQPCRAEAPHVELPLVESAPTAPDWLPNAHAIKEWDRLASILTANRLLTEASLSTLGVLCATHGDLVDDWARGNKPTAAAVGLYRNLANDFGLTPVAQGKVRAGGDEAKSNKFNAIGKRA